MREIPDTTKVDFIFDVLKSTGTSIAAFADMTTISRASLHNWKRGANITDKLRLNLAYESAKKLLELSGASPEDMRAQVGPPWHTS